MRPFARRNLGTKVINVTVSCIASDSATLRCTVIFYIMCYPVQCTVCIAVCYLLLPVLLPVASCLHCCHCHWCQPICLLPYQPCVLRIMITTIVTIIHVQSIDDTTYADACNKRKLGAKIQKSSQHQSCPITQSPYIFLAKLFAFGWHRTGANSGCTV